MSDPSETGDQLVIIDPSVARFFGRWLRLHGYVQTAEWHLIDGLEVEVARVHVPGGPRRPAVSS